MDSNTPTEPPSAAVMALLGHNAMLAAQSAKHPKVRTRLRAAFKAVLQPAWAKIPEQDALMSAVSAVARLSTDKDCDLIQRELFALAQIAAKLGGDESIKDEDIQMPENAIKILVIWENVRKSLGMVRADTSLDAATDIPDQADSSQDEE